jgi:hypothetical protein
MKEETCNQCGARKPRSAMTHVQCGFRVIWKCKTQCKKQTATSRRVITGKKTSESKNQKDS